MIRNLFVASILLVSLVSSLFSAERTFTASQLDERGLIDGLRMSDDRGSLQLATGVLIEDDGPAAGFSYRPNVEAFKPGIAIRKQLVIGDPRAKSATLLVGGSGKFQFEINGRALELESLGKSGNYWEQFRVPVDVLKQGVNDFVISGTGSIWIARDDEYAAGSTTRTTHPNRSAKRKSADALWNDTQLGTKDDIDGEYYMRLHLEQFQREGRITLPVIDRYNLMEQPIAPLPTSKIPLAIRVERTLDDTGAVQIRARSSDSPLFTQTTWSEYQSLGKEQGALNDSTGRYVQIEIEITTSNPLSSPQLRGVHFSAADASSNSKTPKVVESKNLRIIRSSIPFGYQAQDHEKLARLRKQFGLDEVVRGAKSEWEIVERLAVWASQRWHNKGHLGKSYPAWDALDILREHDDGTPVGGFCQQFNLVLLQACQSFGIQGRAVSIGPGNYPLAVKGGHEVIEVWSNEHAKWAYIDGNQAWYAVDAAQKSPLSLLELRERQLAVLQNRATADTQIITLAPTDRKWERLTDWPPFVELRLIPRSNFLSERSPLPLNQGMRGWFWTGHYVWSDNLVPPSLLYAHHVSRRADWEWSVNVCELHLAATDKLDELRVFVDSAAPPGDTIWAKFADGAEQQVSESFVWPLQPGRNPLEVRSRNALGRSGPASWVVVER